MRPHYWALWHRLRRGHWYVPLHPTIVPDYCRTCLQQAMVPR